MSSEDPKSNAFCYNKIFNEAINISKEYNIKIPSQKSETKSWIKSIPEKYKQFIFTEQGSVENNQITWKTDLKFNLFLPILNSIINDLKEIFTYNSNI